MGTAGASGERAHVSGCAGCAVSPQGQSAGRGPVPRTGSPLRGSPVAAARLTSCFLPFLSPLKEGRGGVHGSAVLVPSRLRTSVAVSVPPGTLTHGSPQMLGLPELRERLWGAHPFHLGPQGRPRARAHREQHAPQAPSDHEAAHQSPPVLLAVWGAGHVFVSPFTLLPHPHAFCTDPRGHVTVSLALWHFCWSLFRWQGCSGAGDGDGPSAGGELDAPSQCRRERRALVADAPFLAASSVREHPP